MHLIHPTCQTYLACAQNTISRNTGNPAHCRVSVVYPHDRVANWELWLVATAQHHESISFSNISLALEKIKI